jgi:hypothetical protein
MKGQLRIHQMFAFTIIDEDGTEGVIGALDASGMWRPFVGADMRRVEDLKEIARTFPAFAGLKITILRFGGREEIGTIDRTGEPRDRTAVKM